MSCNSIINTINGIPTKIKIYRHKSYDTFYQYKKAYYIGNSLLGYRSYYTQPNILKTDFESRDYYHGKDSFDESNYICIEVVSV